MIEIDGTTTDQLDDRYRVHIVSASESDSKTVAAAKPQTRDPETTQDLLKALENAAIVIDEPAAAAPPPERPPGYNPYDAGPEPPRKR